MVKELLALAIPVAGLLEEKEKNKYVDELLKIERELADEELKTRPDDGRIAYLHGDLMRITRLLANAIKSKKA